MSRPSTAQLAGRFAAARARANLSELICIGATCSRAMRCNDLCALGSESSSGRLAFSFVPLESLGGARISALPFVVVGVPTYLDGSNRPPMEAMQLLRGRQHG